MSDEATNEAIDETSGEGPAQEPADDSIDWKAEARKWESRAKDNKSAADRLAAIEEANKSEAQRAAERLATAEKAAADAMAEALRFKIAAKFSVSDEDAELFLTGTDEETLTRQADRLARRAEEAGRPRSPKPDPNQGRDSRGTASTADQFAAAVGDLLS